MKEKVGYTHTIDKKKVQYGKKPGRDTEWWLHLVIAVNVLAAFVNIVLSFLRFRK